MPNVTSETIARDKLIAGDFPIIADQYTVLSGNGIHLRGTVMGLVTASGKIIKSLSAAVDGSQTNLMILAEDVDATSADRPVACYLAGEFNAAALILGAAWTAATVKAALRPLGIYVKSMIP